MFKKDMNNRYFKIMDDGNLNWAGTRPVDTNANPQWGTQELLDWLSQGNIPEWVETDEEAREIIKARIVEQCTKATKYEFFMLGHWYQSEITNKVEILGMLVAHLLGLPLPQGEVWRTVDNALVPIDLQLLTALLVSHMQHVQSCYSNRDAHLAALAETNEPQSYNYTTGWPERYVPS